MEDIPMSVRKREWVTQKGEAREAWVVDYVDQDNDRHIRTFARKKEADDYHDTVRVDVRQGVHTPLNKSVTVKEAADDWLTYARLEKLERSTLEQYQTHVSRHILPRIGREKLARLSTTRLNVFRDELLAHMSRVMAQKVLRSLKAILKDAKRRGNVAQNAALEVQIKKDKRAKKKLKVGVDIPTPEEISRIVRHAGEYRPLIQTAISTGLRSSELRGLLWQNIDFKRGELHVTQRADRYNKIGPPKSEAGKRTIPLGPLTLNALREWKLVCPRGELGLVFPNGSGKLEDHGNIITRVLCPIQIAAGVVDTKGRAKYTGLHALRHFYASWCLNRIEDGGLGLPLKLVQERLGHSSIVMTSDIYGHVFKHSDDSNRQLAAAEKLLLA
jgi:integrase